MATAASAAATEGTLFEVDVATTTPFFASFEEPRELGGFEVFMFLKKTFEGKEVAWEEQQLASGEMWLGKEKGEVTASVSAQLE